MVSNGVYADRATDPVAVAHVVRRCLVEMSTLDVDSIGPQAAADALRLMARKALDETGAVSVMSMRAAVALPLAESDGVVAAMAVLKGRHPKATDAELAQDRSALSGIVGRHALLLLAGATDIPVADTRAVVWKTLDGMGEAKAPLRHLDIVKATTRAATTKVAALRAIVARIDAMKGETNPAAENALARARVLDLASAARMDVPSDEKVARDALVASAVERHLVKGPDFDKVLGAALAMDVADVALGRIVDGMGNGAALAGVRSVAASAIDRAMDRTPGTMAQVAEALGAAAPLRR